MFIATTELPDWESERAIAFDVIANGERKRVFIPKKMVREEGGKTYVSDWILKKKREELSQEIAENFLRDFFDTSQTLDDGPKVGGGNFPGVISLFDKAAEKIKYPKLQFSVEGVPVKMRRAGSRSKAPGAIFIDNGEKFHSPNRQYFGRIDRDGSFTPGRDCPEAVAEILQGLNSDPDGTLRSHGKASGNCSACGRLLTEETSVALGIGPVCRARWTV